jgi:sugar phosphate permease
MINDSGGRWDEGRPGQGGGSKWRRTRSIALALLFITGVINYLDRSTLSIANTQIREELHLTPGEMGILLSAFSWTYAFAQLPTGLLVDRIGPRLLLAAGLTLWSIAQACGGLASSLRQLVATRAVLGIGEAPQFPTGARVVSQWYPARDRGLPTGLFNASSSLGPALAPPLLTALMAAFGWRIMFLVMGAAGMVAAAAWYVLYRAPEEAGLSDEELRELRSDDLKRSEVSLKDWASLFRHQTTWGMILGFAGSLYLIWLYLTWLPGFLEKEHHMTTLKVGFAAAVPFVFGFFGSLTGGAASDRLANRGFSPITSRKLPIVVGLLGMALFTVPAALTRRSDAAVLCISMAVFCGNIATANAWALVTATAPPNYVASLGSIQNFGGYFGGSFAPVVTGFVVEKTDSFAWALIIGAGVAVVSAAIYLVLVRAPIVLDPAKGLADDALA